jgi:hypothetical protein
MLGGTNAWDGEELLIADEETTAAACALLGRRGMGA